MRRTFIAMLFLFSAVFLSHAAYAEKMKEPEVDYSGYSVMETGEAAIQGKVYYSHGKLRQEMDMGGMKQIIITRMDKKVVWTLMPAQTIYVELPMSALEGKGEDITDMDVEQTVAGKEIVNGVLTTKYNVRAERKDGTRLDGYTWLTKDGILMKADLTAKDSSNNTRIKMELKDLKVGRQDPSLFEVPAGYNKLGTGGMNVEEMMKGMPGE